MSTLDNVRKEAKRWLKALRQHDPAARARLHRAYPAAPADPGLRDIQHALALERGSVGWTALKVAIALRQAEGARRVTDSETSLQVFERLAQDFSTAYDTGNGAALGRLNAHYGRRFTHDDLRADIWRRMRTVREAGGAAHAFGVAEAREIVARDVGVGSWAALVAALDSAAATGTPPSGRPFAIDSKTHKITPQRHLTSGDWDAVIGVMQDRRLSALDANGQMTDAVLERVSRLDHVTHLSLGGSRELTDEGLQHVARMPQLESLDLSEYPGGRLTDRGLKVLRHLPALRRFQMAWQSGITDAGLANLRVCDAIERVNLLGTPTGDGAIEALSGKRHLRHLSTGQRVTDAGLARLREIPCFASWQGGDIAYGLMGAEAGPTHLLLDGPITDRGLSMLSNLDGLFGLSFFWHISALTSDGLRVLVDLPHLGYLGCERALCDDRAMRHIAAMPRLRMLMGQGAVAGDEGIAALSRSRTLEYIWGRDWNNLTGRGFAALSHVPTLRGLAVNCAHVDDDALSLLPRFPALRQLVPIGVGDEGFRHVGRCEALESLWCMYCRDTTDRATEHLAGLSRLTKYYAGATQITDRSLEILGGMPSLEEIELYECAGVSDAGLAHLAALPRLRELELGGLPGVTLAGTAVFPDRVRVGYWQ